MSVVKRVLTASLVLALVTCGVLAGCSETLSAQGISDKTVAASSNVDTVKMDVSMSMEMSGSSGADSFNLTALETGTEWVRNAGKEMKANMDVSLDIGILDKQNASVQIFVLNGWMYMGATLSGFGEQWVKSAMTDKYWQTQDQLAQQTEFLKTAVTVTLLGSEKVDGTDCYILQINPDMAAITEWFLSQQEQQSSGIDWSQIDLSDIFKNYSIKAWIAKGSYLPIKEEIELTLEMTPQDLGAGADETGKVTMSMNGQVKFYDYNKPFTIELPPEAATATDISSSSSY